MELMGSGNLLLIDARGGPDAAKNYQVQHIPGAIFVDLETDLSDIGKEAKNGGRHPLPDPAAFTRFLRGIGIQPNTHVVVYDDRFGAMAAARFWWMLRALGHEKVQVLDGGLAAALKAQVPAASGIEKHATGETEAAGLSHDEKTQDWKLPLASMEEVSAASGDPSRLIIDVREPERYRGETEPYDLVAGHIPGAVNIFYGSNLDENGYFLSPGQLQAKYEPLFKKYGIRHIILHCGSGVSACQTLLAMDYAGLGIPSIYVGSYSEWIRNGKPVVTK